MSRHTVRRAAPQKLIGSDKKVARERRKNWWLISPNHDCRFRISGVRWDRPQFLGYQPNGSITLDIFLPPILFASLTQGFKSIFEKPPATAWVFLNAHS